MDDSSHVTILVVLIKFSSAIVISWSTEERFFKVRLGAIIVTTEQSFVFPGAIGLRRLAPLAFPPPTGSAGRVPLGSPTAIPPCGASHPPSATLLQHLLVTRPPSRPGPPYGRCSQLPNQR